MGKKWNKDSGPGEKLLRLFSLLLFAHQRYSLTALAEILECSKQTVLRLIDQLEAAGWAKVKRQDVGRRAIFWIERPGALPKVSLSPEGIRELMLCRAFLEHMLPRTLDSKADTALRQSFAYIPEADSLSAAVTGKIGGALSKGRIDYSLVRGELETLIQAASNKTVCEVAYTSATSGEARTFDFAPMRILAHGESLYVAGWEVKPKGTPLPVHDDATTLLAHRIKQVRLTRRIWDKLPEPADTGNFGIMRGEPFSVSIKITTPEATTYVAERIWSEDQKIVGHEDGSLTLTMTTQSAPETVAWVLSLGSAAEVLAPQWLREEIAGEVAVLHVRYAAEVDIISGPAANL
ncbi:WYL domain-containing transcriptional regulator [Desulfovibrio sp. OttesenSCG-928-G11]|nr:WYL domain-containing transcriptional regulator [Desulfovibrio sp. OttesenSCG-928-G11]